MGNLTLNGSTSGQVTLTPPAVAGTNTITLPAATGTVLTTAGGQTISGTVTLSTLTSPAATNLTIQSAGTTAMTIDTSQNVGIGTTTINNRLVVQSSSAEEGITIRGNGFDAIKIGMVNPGVSNDGIISVKINNALRFSTNDTERMRIDSSGNVGINSTSPGGTNGKLYVVGSTGDNIVGWGDGATGGRLGTVSSVGAKISADGAIVFGTGASYTERARITSSGTLLVGRTNIVGGETFGVKGAGTGATWAIYNENSAGSILHAVFNNGAFYTGGAANSPYNNTTASAANCFINSDNGFLQRSTSSLKYKTDVKDATHGLAEVMQLRPVTYKGKNDGDTVFGGLIAEEVDAVGLTEFVQYAEDGSPDALAYGNMVSLLVKSIQEQQAIISDLKSRIAALEAK